MKATGAGKDSKNNEIGGGFMCTALALRSDRLWFGRTLDIEEPYGETVVLAPRLFPFRFRHAGARDRGLAMLGAAHLHRGVPLYYDAVNECGLAMAALRFPKYAVYRPASGKESVASFELIPYLLGLCRSMTEAKERLEGLSIADGAVSDELRTTPLHWLLSDGRRSLVIEPLASGLAVTEAPLGVLTNAPPYAEQLENPALQTLHREHAEGLPGDFSSPSRFARMAYVRQNARGVSTPERCFHLLDTVTVPHGCATGIEGRPISTRYTACIDLSRGIYYSATDTRRSLREAHLFAFDLETAALSTFPL